MKNVINYESKINATFKNEENFQSQTIIFGDYLKINLNQKNQCIESFLIQKAFDLILFLGVYYHLINPLLAIQNLYKISKELVIFEGEILETNRNIAYILEEGEPGGKFLFSPSFINRTLSYVIRDVFYTHMR